MSNVTTENVQYLKIELDIPNHCEELKYANDNLIKIKDKFNTVQEKNSINDVLHESLYESTMRVLDYVGRLSLKINDNNNDNASKLIEDAYFKAYPHAPALAKKLWLEHFENIYHPYDILKNRCFRLLDDIDDEYIKQIKRVPPNWNP